jgi:hypothetical protein
LERETFTAISALVAALAGVINLIRSMRVPKDRIRIGFGFPQNAYEPGAELDVQNLSPHEVRLRDFGFILDSYKRFSLPDHHAAANGHDERLAYGNTTIASRGVFQGRFAGNINEIAAYAYTTTQNFPRIKFRHNISSWKKLKTRWIVYKSFAGGLAYW